MRCTSKIALIVSLCLLLSVITGCSSSMGMRFKDNANQSNFNFLVNGSGSAEVADAFAESLAVVSPDHQDEKLQNMNDNAAAALFNCNTRETIYANNAYTKLYPASLTKIMTALVALQHASSDTILTASENVVITESQAQVIGLSPGDTMTLEQALNILLIYSANDVAVLIAENIGGTSENFIKMMNDEAKALGATNTNFINSNGLSDNNHFTTAYDMYVIFNAALEYNTFAEIISRQTYETVYHSRTGEDKEVKIASTNYYLEGMANAPTGVTVVGGKTGTTDAAGHCLIILARNTGGIPFVAVVMRARDNDELYADMNELLSLMPQ